MPANGTGAATALQIRNETTTATAENFIMSGIVRVAVSGGAGM